jgi:plasmid stabilization system protein ParE
MSAIVWLQEALDDLNRVYAFLESKNPDAAARAVQAIFEAADSLAENPFRCPQVRTNPSRRKLRVFWGKRGYLIYFEIQDDTIYILQIWQGLEDRPA